MTEKLEALKAGKSIDFAVNSAPKCPHCGHVLDIHHADRWDIYDDQNTHEIECPSCELQYRVRTYARYSFSTDNQEDI